MLISDVAVYDIFIVEANSGDIEEPDVVLVCDPERSIVLVFQIHLSLRRLCPLGGFVAPVSLPLFVAPGVSNLQQALCLPVVKLDDLGGDQTVSMTVAEILVFDGFARDVTSLRSNRAAHRKVLLLRREYSVPELVFVQYVGMDEEFVWASRHGVHGFSCCASLDTLVTSKDLRPCLFKDQGPDLLDAVIARRPAHCPPICVSIVRKVVIDYNSALLSVHVE